mgnify:CR=1 FL=1
MPALSVQRPLPAGIAAAQADMEGHARDYGLDFYETIFEVLDYDEINMVAASSMAAAMPARIATSRTASRARRPRGSWFERSRQSRE